MKQSKSINGHTHILYEHNKPGAEELIKRSKEFYSLMDKRRSVRTFSEETIPQEVIENIIKTASTAPSGAHKQPWTFCVVSNPELKKKIKEAAEAEERESYESRMSERWKEDLKPLATDAHKPFLEDAPFLIVLCKRAYDYDENGNKVNNYYVNESVGIAAGMLITAIHNAGLVTLTHTPSPMNFLTELLERPQNERAFLLLPVGYPQDPTYVPELKRKSLEEIAVFY
ncbi:MAG: nitroreductase family protein [Brumimicrobium sp.]|nr:nitroreductase family protein [Brumimicrobium sp.]